MRQPQGIEEVQPVGTSMEESSAMVTATPTPSVVISLNQPVVADIIPQEAHLVIRVIFCGNMIWNQRHRPNPRWDKCLMAAKVTPIPAQHPIPTYWRYFSGDNCKMGDLAEDARFPSRLLTASYTRANPPNPRITSAMLG